MKNMNEDIRSKQCYGLAVRIYLVILIVLALSSCDSRPSKTEQEWQRSFRLALIDGYTNFKKHFVDGDVGVYIFSYQLPSKLTTKEVFSILKNRISGFVVISEAKNELVLRRSGTSQTHEAFDEYRFLVDEGRGKVSVMFASLDSPVEIKNHSFFVNKLQEISEMN